MSLAKIAGTKTGASRTGLKLTRTAERGSPPHSGHRRRGRRKKEGSPRQGAPLRCPAMTSTAALGTLEMSPDDARRLALAAQQLVGVPDRRAGVSGLVRSLGAVQLDTISVLARSHELVAYARLGAIGRSKIE